MAGALPRIVLPLLLALVAPAASAQGSLRCDGGLVAVGDSKLDLLGKCGRPALVEELLGDRGAAGAQDPQATWGIRVTATVERWTYDFGPNQFVGYVTLDTGKIVAIERGSYGYARAPAPPPPPVPRARCEPAGFHEGDSTFDVLARCGPPATRDARIETQAVWSGGDGGPPVVTAWRSVTVEVWGYDFGPRSFLRFLTFADGKLVKVETGSYGYAR